MFDFVLSNKIWINSNGTDVTSWSEICLFYFIFKEYIPWYTP